MADKYNLNRFLEAQNQDNMYQTALEELRAGAKESHWIWYVFPQHIKLNRSETDRAYGITCADEAKAYMQNVILRRRLLEACKVLYEIEADDLVSIVSLVDAYKIRSSCTLFKEVTPEYDIFGKILDKFCRGIPCENTMRILKAEADMYGRNLVTGDTHGDTSRLYTYTRFLRKGDVLWIAGDFGYLFRNDESEQNFLTEINETLEQRDAYIAFCDGNHENHAALNELPEEEWCGARVHRLRSRIIHVIRGEIAVVNNKKILCFGGAYSIDRHMRHLNVSYWEEEMPTNRDYQNAIRNLETAEHEVDYIITHTCPLESAPMLTSNHDNIQERALQNFLEWIREKTDYKHWYFGHWHLDRDIWMRQTAIYRHVVNMETEEILFGE